MFWELEGSRGDSVHEVQRDPLDLLTVEHDEVIFEDQERVVCDKSKPFFFIVPMIHPGTITTSVRVWQ